MYVTWETPAGKHSTRQHLRYMQGSRTLEGQEIYIRIVFRGTEVHSVACERWEVSQVQRPFRDLTIQMLCVAFQIYFDPLPRGVERP